MAITFPIAMPANGVATQYFEPERVDYQTQQAKGRVNGVQAGFPLWHASFSFGSSISRATSDEWRGFVAVLRGCQRTFFGADQSRPYPLATPRGFAGLTRAGGGAFDGSATSWSVNSDRDVVTLSGQPVGLVLGVGDYGMLRWNTGGEARRSLHRVILGGGGVANGSGVVAVTVEPPVPTLVPGTAVWDLAKPNCIMKQKPDSKIGSMGRAQRVDGAVTAIQDLRP